jgi:hypothetical protein
MFGANSWREGKIRAARGLVQTSDGEFYGVASGSGANGTVFEWIDE